MFSEKDPSGRFGEGQPPPLGREAAGGRAWSRRDRCRCQPGRQHRVMACVILGASQERGRNDTSQDGCQREIKQSRGWSVEHVHIG